MFLRILLGVACLSLMSATEAEAQLFRRRFAPRTAQPQQSSPPVRYSQNGYQGRPTASQPTRQLYVRRSDGSVVPYYPARTAQAATVRTQQTINPAALARPVRQPRLVTTQGQLEAVRPSAQVQARVSSVYQPPTATSVAPQTRVAPVGVSVMSQPAAQTTIGAISPATPMPQASMIDPASSIPISTTATNPAPTGLSLSLPDDVVPASASVPVETPTAGQSLEQETFSVLETIE